MPRNWNTTGLYKAQRDRMPAKRSRRIRSTPPASKLIVSNEPGSMCPGCGYGLWTPAHYIVCIEAHP